MIVYKSDSTQLESELFRPTNMNLLQIKIQFIDDDNDDDDD